MHQLRIELDASARDELVARGFSPTFGARHLAATLESVCNVEIAKKIRRDDRSRAGDRDALVFVDGEFEFVACCAKEAE